MICIALFVFSLLITDVTFSMSIYRVDFAGPSPLWYTPTMVEHSGHLIRSYYEKSGGKELVPLSLLESDPVAAAKELFFLPNRVVVSHGIQCGSDGPIMNYGNSAALQRWAASWEQMTTMHSKYTAEPMLQAEREEFLRRVLTDGIINDYVGVRISLDKSRFRMLDGSVWNVDANGQRIGQAATFSKWDDL
jgi:hypothetical protein